MFELVGDDTIRYIGGVEQWKENFVTNIRMKGENRKYLSFSIFTFPLI